MRTGIHFHRWLTLSAAALVLLGSALTASAVTVGAGINVINATTADGAGGRLNIDRVNTATPAADTYRIDQVSFNFTSGAGGVVTPFLAELTGPGRTYEILWVGPGIQPGAGTGVRTFNITGTPNITLDGSTTVFAGIHHDGVAKVLLNLGGVITPTDHDGTPALPSAIGQVIADADISNKNLSDRTYAFDIQFNPVASTPVVQLGAGSNIGNAFDQDNAGARLNIDRVNTFTLAAGKYDVTNAAFAFANTSTDGDVIPFIARLTGPGRTYEIVWVGDEITPAIGTGLHTESYAVGTEEFTLDADTELFAGIFHDGIAKVLISFPFDTLLDHDGTPAIPSSIGQIITDAEISNKGLNDRTYAFEINVQAVAAVPEPATALLGLLGAAGLMLRRRRAE